jgi:hypothetical protein
MLLRSWIAFSVVIALLQAVLGLLSVFQHNAVLSDLLRQRISVIAQTTAASFKPIIDLGLPISMIRNGDAIVARALQTDPEVRAVHAVNPSGIIVYTTDAFQAGGSDAGSTAGDAAVAGHRMEHGNRRAYP